MYYVLAAAATTSVALIASVALQSTSIKPEGLLAKMELPHKDSFSIPRNNSNQDVKNLARAFYTSPLFKLERIVLKYCYGI